jgi:hypothetical protein
MDNGCTVASRSVAGRHLGTVLRHHRSMVRFAAEIVDDIVVNLETAKALMLTVGLDGGGCRSAAGGRLPVSGVRQEWL